jgi:site-specific recombinase XerD
METPTWSAACQGFRDYLLTNGKSENTARTYLGSLSVFWESCLRYEGTPIDIERSALRAWLSQRLEAGISAARVHNDLVALRHFYAWLIDDRWREDDPTARLQIKRGESLPTKPFEEEELQRLVANCRLERDRLMLLMLACTGQRIAELAAMTAEDIDWSRGIVIVKGKGDKERQGAPIQALLGRLRAYLGMFPEGPLWLSNRGRPLSAHQIRKIIYEIAARAGVDDVHPHRFRATFSVAHIEQFGDINALQSILGHANIQTTARYLEWTKEKRALDQMRRLNLASRLLA